MAGALGAGWESTAMMSEHRSGDPDRLTLFLGGDVMSGRGLDQIMPHPVGPRLYEPYVKDARAYVELAEQVNGPIPRPVDYDYIWGDALAELRRRSPGVRIINLETSVTTSERYWRDKGIHYRMHPRNVPCLQMADIDCCVLANNHVLDWGHAGLQETLDTLRGSGLQTAGAGMDEAAAAAPALLQAGGGRRIVVFSFAHVSSGVPGAWKATAESPGVNLLPDLTTATADHIARAVASVKTAGDVVVASIHWGGNWGYGVPKEHRGFAHQLIDHAGVDIVHGHSSHHPLGLEVHHGRPVLYGCGDLLNDYEGIRGYEEYRPDLALMYFITLDAADGELAGLELVPMRMARMRLNRVSRADAEWLQTMLNREGRDLGTGVDMDSAGTLRLNW